MGDARGWNKCSCCGRFCGEGLVIEERIELTMYGDLIQEWPVMCARCQPLQHTHPVKVKEGK